MRIFTVFVLLLAATNCFAQSVSMGKGSYSTKPPAYNNGTTDPKHPSNNRPVNITGPAVSSSNSDLRWQPLHPAVTEQFRNSGKKITTNQFWSSLMFKYNGGKYSNMMFPGPIAAKCDSNGLLLNNQRNILAFDRVTDGEYTTANFAVTISELTSLRVGFEGAVADSALVDDYGDWHVRAAWTKSTGETLMKATIARGCPYVYFEGVSATPILFSNDPNTRFSTWNTNDSLAFGIKNESTCEYWILFLPEGSEFKLNRTDAAPAPPYFFNKLTIDLKGKDYFSIAAVFDSNATATTIQTMKKHAFAFVTGTNAKWNYDEATATVRTDFEFITTAKQGTETNTIMTLFPHQYLNLDKEYAFSPLKYPTARGWAKAIEGTKFSTELRNPGLLYHFPKLIDSAETFSKDTLSTYLNQFAKLRDIELLPDFNTTYGHGKSLLRAMCAAEAANSIGADTLSRFWESRTKHIFEDWMTATIAEIDSSRSSGLVHGKGSNNQDTLVADTNSIGNYLLFYYNKEWNTIYGFPAAFGTDEQINDHHFTWGYFIKTLIELMGAEGNAYGSDTCWGGMAKMLIRDIVGDYRSPADGGISDRGDTLFPRFRNWDPYMGYGLASGHADFPNGNNQESTSEAMNMYSSIALFGGMTGSNYYRDLGLYLFSTQLSTIENYWFDLKKQNLCRAPREWCPKEKNGRYSNPYDSIVYPWPMASIVWDGKADLATFFSSAIEKIIGIQFLPLTPTSLYLGRYPSWQVDVNNNLLEKLQKKVGGKTTNAWQNIMWSAHAMYNPSYALDEFNNFRNFTSDTAIAAEDSSKSSFGEAGTTRSYTYYWLNMFEALGVLDTAIHTYSTPFYAVFNNQDKNLNTYIAYNPTSVAQDVVFSNGETFNVAPNSTGYLRKIAAVAPKSGIPPAQLGFAVDFDTLDVGDDKTRMYVYQNNTQFAQEIDDIEIPDTTDQGFYLRFLTKSKILQPGREYVGIVGFRPLSSGFKQDTIIMVIDSALGTTPPFEIYISGFVRGDVGVTDEQPKAKVLKLIASPNPATSIVRLSFGAEPIASGTRIELFDVGGKLEFSYKANAETKDCEIPTDFLSGGAYIVRITMGNTVYSTKLIVVR